LSKVVARVYHRKMKTLPPRIAKIRDSIMAVEEGRACILPTIQPPPGVNQMEWMNREQRAPYTDEETFALDDLISGRI
jgi:hypothetical protein